MRRNHVVARPLQVLARHIEPMMSNLRAILAHRKFKREPLESVGTPRMF